MKVYSLPTPEQAAEDRSNAINQIVVRLRDHLLKYDVEIVSSGATADLIVGHAGQTDGKTIVDVAHIHGLYPTAHSAQFETPNWHWAANWHVIENVRSAKRVTVPSQWVADLFRRDMHIDPDVIGWAIDPDEWTPGEDQGYVLWNKTRSDGVCSPKPVIELAARVPGQRFLTTFGSGTPNIREIGRQTFEDMQPLVRGASVYLATTLETFGIGVLEAMACEIPILGFNWGGTADIVQHGVTGYLVEPGDYEGLKAGLEYCLKHRKVLGTNARQVALGYTWDKVAEKFATIYREVLKPSIAPKVSVIIPCHNYAQYVATAIKSVITQETSFRFGLTVVLDRCTDNSEQIVREALKPKEPYNARCTTSWVTTDYGNPADARNHGIERSSGEYICTLDADDMLGHPKFLQTLADAMDRDRTLGITFTGLRMMDAEGNLGGQTDWPNGYDYDQQVVRHNQVPTCCLFRREAWTRAGGYRRRYVPAEDADLWLRIGSLGYRGKQVTTEPWFVYRLHSDSLSRDVREGKRPEPDWVGDKPWTSDGNRPFASDGIAAMRSWPVRNYCRPKVSVIIPVGPGHAYYLPEALDSVEGQTERFWECIVINDSGQELDLRAFPWARVYDTQGPKGAAFARNRGIELAKAPLIAFLDADDILSPRFLELTMRAYAKTGYYAYVDWVSQNKEGMMEIHETPDYRPNDVFAKPSIHSINVLIPKTALQQVGGFDESMHTWEDVDLFMKLAKAGICGTRVPEPLVLYRYTTGNLREIGETIKDDLRQLLHVRYREYIEGEKMCDCGNKPKPIQLGEATITGGGPAPDGAKLVRVEYSGPIGQHAVIGMNTKQNYGRRAGGDVFYVYAEDQQAQPDRFTPIADVASVLSETPMPPEPVLI